MSLLRKSLLAVVPVVALCVPFMAAAPAQAHEHWEHHEHFHDYPYYWYPGHRLPLVVAPSVVVSSPVVDPAPVTLYYRVNSISPWVPYSTFPDVDAANSMGSSLQQHGYEVFIQ